jgi:hypothetical protein
MGCKLDNRYSEAIANDITRDIVKDKLKAEDSAVGYKATKAAVKVCTGTSSDHANSRLETKGVMLNPALI